MWGGSCLNDLSHFLASARQRGLSLNLNRSIYPSTPPNLNDSHPPSSPPYPLGSLFLLFPPPTMPPGLFSRVAGNLYRDKQQSSPLPVTRSNQETLRQMNVDHVLVRDPIHKAVPAAFSNISSSSVPDPVADSRTSPMPSLARLAASSALLACLWVHAARSLFDAPYMAERALDSFIAMACGERPRH